MDNFYDLLLLDMKLQFFLKRYYLKIKICSNFKSLKYLKRKN